MGPACEDTFGLGLKWDHVNLIKKLSMLTVTLLEKPID